MRAFPGANFCKRRLPAYFHLAIALATCFKLVTRHFAPSPTSEARRCCSAAARGLRRAFRIAAIRLRASCFFTSRNEIFFTHQRIQHLALGDKLLPVGILRTERAFLKTGAERSRTGVK